MNLNYRILWFEDEQGWLDSLDLDPLKNSISDWGFAADIRFVNDSAGFMAASPFADLDLIVVDYDLGTGAEHGEAFIDRVRNNQCWTEVIFYSAAQADKLWDAVRARKLEGVFVANRQNVLSKIEKVGEQTVRKVVDLNMTRGLVMAEIGELDLLIDALVDRALTDLDHEIRSKIFTRFHEEASKQANERVSHLNDFGSAPTVQRMIEMSDSNKRFANLRRVMKGHAKLKARPMGNFVEEVLSPRNFLAHGIPTIEGDCHVFSYGGKQYRYDHPESVRLRKTILQYKSSFEALRDLLA